MLLSLNCFFKSTAISHANSILSASQTFFLLLYICLRIHLHIKAWPKSRLRDLVVCYSASDVLAFEAFQWSGNEVESASVFLPMSSLSHSLLLSVFLFLDISLSLCCFTTRFCQLGF